MTDEHAPVNPRSARRLESSYRPSFPPLPSAIRYIFSDGLAHDPSQCIDFLEARIRHGQAVPIIHTVGFFPEGAPENFEGRRYLQTLSAMTGGTFQEYEKNAQVRDPPAGFAYVCLTGRDLLRLSSLYFHQSHAMAMMRNDLVLCKQKIYQDGSFVKYDTKAEPSSDRVEREWAESQLRAERKKNLRLGISERLEVTLARVQALHTQSRVQTKQKEHDELLASLRAQYELEVRGGHHCHRFRNCNTKSPGDQGPLLSDGWNDPLPGPLAPL